MSGKHYNHSDFTAVCSRHISGNTTGISGTTCGKCGGYTQLVTFTWNSTLPPKMCECKTSSNVGWICPMCNRSCSPYSSHCDCVKHFDYYGKFEYTPEYVPEEIPFNPMDYGINNPIPDTIQFHPTLDKEFELPKDLGQDGYGNYHGWIYKTKF